MTDWCLSKITFIGPEEELQALVENFDSKVSRCGTRLYQLFGEHFLPQPPFIQTSLSDRRRQWAYEHWGCKYGNHGATLESFDTNQVSFMLKTDWNPPTKALCWLTGLPEYQNINVRVEYEIQGDFCDPFEITEPTGYCVFSQGKLIMEAEHFYEQAEVLCYQDSTTD